MRSKRLLNKKYRSRCKKQYTMKHISKGGRRLNKRSNMTGGGSLCDFFDVKKPIIKLDGMKEDILCNRQYIWKNRKDIGIATEQQKKTDEKTYAKNDFCQTSKEDIEKLVNQSKVKVKVEGKDEDEDVAKLSKDNIDKSIKKCNENGIPRFHMPQVPVEPDEPFPGMFGAQMLKDIYGINFKYEAKYNLSALTPTQSEGLRGKIFGMTLTMAEVPNGNNGTNGLPFIPMPKLPIIISNNDYVIDGHHRFFAAIAAGEETIPVIILDSTMEEVLPLLISIAPEVKDLEDDKQEYYSEINPSTYAKSIMHKYPKHDHFLRNVISREEEEHRGPSRVKSA